MIRAEISWESTKTGKDKEKVSVSWTSAGSRRINGRDQYIDFLISCSYSVEFRQPIPKVLSHTSCIQLLIKRLTSERSGPNHNSPNLTYFFFTKANGANFPVSVSAIQRFRGFVSDLRAKRWRSISHVTVPKSILRSNTRYSS